MITVDHDLPPTPSNIPNVPFQVMAFYKALSTRNAKSPLFAGTTLNLTLAMSNMLLGRFSQIEG